MNAKKIGGITLVAAALVLVTSAAQAVVVKGRGELTAAGNGFAVLDFRGGATLAGVGIAIVEEDALVDTHGEGRVTPIDNGRLLLEGFGRIVVRSLEERTRVEVAGSKLRLRARGVGRALLKGVGHYMTDDLDGTWNHDQILEFDGG
jgi:hypothetical protein